MVLVQTYIEIEIVSNRIFDSRFITLMVLVYIEIKIVLNGIFVIGNHIKTGISTTIRRTIDDRVTIGSLGITGE